MTDLEKFRLVEEDKTHEWCGTCRGEGCLHTNDAPYQCGDCNGEGVVAKIDEELSDV